MKKDKNKMLYNNIKLANSDFIKELQDKLKKIQEEEERTISNLKRLENE